MNTPFYLHVTTTGFIIVQGRLTASQLKAGRVQHYPNGVTVHYAKGLYLVCNPEMYEAEDGTGLEAGYAKRRTAASAHRCATTISNTRGYQARASAKEARVHGVAPYTPAQRLADAWGQR